MQTSGTQLVDTRMYVNGCDFNADSSCYLTAHTSKRLAIINEIYYLQQLQQPLPPMRTNVHCDSVDFVAQWSRRQ